MKRPLLRVYLAGLMVAVFTFAAVRQQVLARLAAPEMEHARPLVVLDRQVCDFGIVPPARQLRAKFLLKNQGTKRAIVREDVPDCDACEKASLIHVINVGDSVHIELLLPTPQQSGRVEQQHSFLTNDPRLPRFTLTLQANVN